MKILKHFREKLAYIASARVNHKGWEMGVGYFGPASYAAWRDFH
jgi:hypothetical protein